ncbi:MAG: T9SS type A sorting domain-containing protein [Melioribacteraceae bacterium]|nr:T9SS type A sorting domain-containing protein [Melioribacteraceae bacterium]
MKNIIKFVILFCITTAILHAEGSYVTISSGAYMTLTSNGDNKSYIINSGSGDGLITVNEGGHFTSWGPEALIDFSVTGGGDITLPVELTDFEASYSKNNVVLNWITQSETDNLGFNLYRSENENGFEEENYIQINSTLIEGMGTTSTPTNYSFADEYPNIEGHTYWYWLQSVSTSNELELFGPVSIEIPFAAQLPTMTILSSNYPNPFNPETTIAFSVKENEEGILTIFNLKGQRVLKETFEAGNHQYHWNAEGFSSGMYLYKLSSPTINITKKMILMK